MSTRRTLFCCGCNKDVNACLTDGGEIYPHRPDLHHLPFWRCDACGNFVGCHHKTANRTKPLGCIPTKELKVARQNVHAVIDPIWKSGRVSRRDLYRKLAEALGVPEYHTAELRSVEQAQLVIRAAQEFQPKENDQ